MGMTVTPKSSNHWSPSTGAIEGIDGVAHPGPDGKLPGHGSGTAPVTGVPTMDEFLRGTVAPRESSLSCLYLQYPEFMPGPQGLTRMGAEKRDDYLDGYRRALEGQKSCSPAEITEMVSAKYQAIELDRFRELARWMNVAVSSEALKGALTDDAFEPLGEHYQAMGAAPKEAVVQLLRHLAFDMDKQDLTEQAVSDLSSQLASPNETGRRLRQAQQHRYPPAYSPAGFRLPPPGALHGDARVEQASGRRHTIPRSEVNQWLAGEWDRRLTQARSGIEAGRADGTIDEPDQRVLELFVRSAEAWVKGWAKAEMHDEPVPQAAEEPAAAARKEDSAEKLGTHVCRDGGRATGRNGTEACLKFGGQ